MDVYRRYKRRLMYCAITVGVVVGLYVAMWVGLAVAIVMEGR